MGQSYHPVYTLVIMFSSCVCASRKKGERLDWMYSAAAGQVDHEMYLLGKPVDKAVDPMAQENEEVGLNSSKSLWLVTEVGTQSFP